MFVFVAFPLALFVITRSHTRHTLQDAVHVAGEVHRPLVERACRQRHDVLRAHLISAEKVLIPLFPQHFFFKSARHVLRRDHDVQHPGAVLQASAVRCYVGGGVM